MGIFDRVTAQAKAAFLDIIEWVDDSRDTLVWRYPIFERSITDQSKLVVREGQVAVFLSQGKLSEVFQPGTYTLDTANGPITAFFRSIAYAMHTPFKGDVLFVNTRQFTANKWGTPSPFLMRDPDFGPIRITAFGVYAYRVTDAVQFIREIVGTDSALTIDEINGQIRAHVISSVVSGIAGQHKSVLDLSSDYLSLGKGLRGEVSESLEQNYGLTLTDLSVGNIGLPEEVQKAIDTRSRMGVLGDLGDYTRMQAADAIGDAARNTGIGGMAASTGVGFGLGQMIGNAMSGAIAPGMAAAAQASAAAPPPPPQQSPPPPPQTPPPPPNTPEAKWHYSGPDGQAELTRADILTRIIANRSVDHFVWQPGWPAWKRWQEVLDIANHVPPPPPPGN